MQVEGFTEEKELDQWLAKLDTPPGERLRVRSRQQTPGWLDSFGGGVA